MSTDASRANRLARSSSPYLLLHQFNPVDWYPWGSEALERARREDKPLFLSVGYSTCYWCHVMERESFSDPDLADFMNRNFVNVKLDREERPELDEIYMTATQLITGQGGWPNSVFLFPDLRPFFAGTYFPPEERHGRPGFGTVLGAVAEAWRSKRAELEEHAAELTVAMRHFLEERGEPSAEAPGKEATEASFASLRRRFDATWGGFGAAPKFPTPANLFFLEERAAAAAADEAAGPMLSLTLDAMDRGGIHDQLAGGFHRYATDREWRVPHFEKMLYDNGLLLELFAGEFARTGSADAARVVRRTAGFLEREMTAPGGAFWSAIDAETDGHEGAFYVWTREALDAALGVEDADFLAPLLGFDRPPFFEQRAYVLHRPAAWEVLAARRQMTREALLAEVDPLLDRLLAARAHRRRPLTDDKILAEWNGMAIRGLARAGEALREPAFVAAAARAAEFVLSELRPAGSPLRRAHRAAASEVPAFLADYVYLVRGLLGLLSATRDGRWLEAARALHAEQQRRLSDPRGGYFTAAESADVSFRSREVFDGAVPAANAIAAWNALELAEATGESRFADEAHAIARAFGGVLHSQPEGPRMLAALLPRLGGVAGGPSAAPAAGPGSSAVHVRMTFATAAGERAAERTFALDVTIDEGWSCRPPDGLRLDVEGGEILEIDDPGHGEGAFQVRGRLRKDAPRTRLVATFHVCDDERCLAPARRDWDVG
jgi:uncharacterized protein YyaL (SSP411 family)